MLGECHISFFILSSLYFYLTLSILGRYSDLGVSANLHISFYPPYTSTGNDGRREMIFHAVFNGWDFCITTSLLYFSPHLGIVMRIYRDGWQG